MKDPRVISEKKRTVLERSPPPKDYVEPHSWLRGERRTEIEEALAGMGPLPLYVSKTAETKMRNHSVSSGRRGLEAMGLLVGDVFTFMDKRHTIVHDVVTTDLQSSSVSVTFDRDGFEKLFERLDDAGSDFIIVGWYHSHPGHTCFMSARDIETQRSIFKEDYHFAIVFDPIELGIEAYTLFEGRCVPANFAIFREKLEDAHR